MTTYSVHPHPTEPLRDTAVDLGLTAADLPRGMLSEIGENITGLHDCHDAVATITEQCLATWQACPQCAFIEEGEWPMWIQVRALSASMGERARLRCYLTWYDDLDRLEQLPFDYDDHDPQLPSWPTLDEVSEYIVAELFASISYLIMERVAATYKDWLDRQLSGPGRAAQLLETLDMAPCESLEQVLERGHQIT